MKTNRISAVVILALAMGMFPFKSHAQLAVIDAPNITQSIVNSVLEISEASTTATNVISTFKEAKKIYQQSKEYYDKLKAVSNLVKDAAKVQKTVLMVGEITDIYFNNYEKMLSDKNYSVAELTAMAAGYAKLLQEATDILKELKQAVNENGMSMSDKERLDIIDRAYNGVKHYRDLTAYYTRKNISVSYIRSQKSGDTDRVLKLYGKSDERYW